MTATTEISKSEAKGSPRRLLVKIGCAGLAYLLFVFGFGLLTSLPGNAPVRRTIVEGFSHDAIAVPQTYTTRYGGDAFTDCLVMSSGLFRHRSIWLDAFDTFWFYPDETKDLHPCDRMRFALDHNLNTRFDHVDEKYEYTRYWLGQRYLFQLMATLSSDLLWIRSLYATSTYVLMGLLTLVSFTRGLKFGAVVGSIALCLALGFGIELHGRDIAHAPAIIVALILLCYFTVKARSMRPFENRLVFAFISGAVLVYFETLAGSHPLFSALLLTVNYFGFGQTQNQNSLTRWKDYFPQALMLLTSVAAGGFYSLAIRFGLGVALYNRRVVMGHFIGQARFRLSDQAWGATVSLADIVSSLWHWRAHFFHGSTSLASVMMAGLGVCWALGVIAMIAIAIIRRSQAPLVDLVALLLPAAAMPTWFVLLKSHTMIHAWLMGRFMVVPASFGLAAFVLASLSVIEMLTIRRRSVCANLPSPTSSPAP